MCSDFLKNLIFFLNLIFQHLCDIYKVLNFFQLNDIH